MPSNLHNISFTDAEHDEHLSKALRIGSRIIELRFCEFTSCSHEDLAFQVFQAMCMAANLQTIPLPFPKHR